MGSYGQGNPLVYIERVVACSDACCCKTGYQANKIIIKSMPFSNLDGERRIKDWLFLYIRFHYHCMIGNLTKMESEG